MPTSPPDSSEHLPGLCILAVDDDAGARLVISTLLSEAGHRVLLADGGRSGLTQLDNEAVDLVLLDLSMPDLDGFEVLKIFRSRPSSRWQPVIVVSANDTEALILQALEAGADDYVTKPIDAGFLMAKIRNFGRGISVQRRNLSLLASLRDKQEALLARQAYELELGRRIQNTLLVGNLPSSPSGFRVSSRAEAAAGVNGDFLEVVSLSPQSVDLVVGDVMGKGSLAALMGAQIKLQISRTIAERFALHVGRMPSPAEIVNAIHENLTPKLQELDSFVTLAYVRMDRGDAQIRAVCCGHIPPLLLRSGLARPIGAQHVPLGVLVDEVYTESVHTLIPGDALVFCSDGVTEARRANGDMFGEAMLSQAALLARALSCAPGLILESIRTDVMGFLQGETPNDDLTLMVTTAPLESENSQCIELPRQLSRVAAVRKFVHLFCSQAHVPLGTLERIELATTQVFTHLVQGGESHLDSSVVELSLRADAGQVVATLESVGTPDGASDWWRGDRNHATGSDANTALHSIERACDRIRFERSHHLHRVVMEFDPPDGLA
jgi:serine phosphatase RsbU (regulator of sigma subunit)/anti-sigma regulatory factor (Ser/Thr protein kinase)